MRKLIGILVLMAGLAGLGVWAATTHAVRIEQAIAADVERTLEAAGDGVLAQVSGRDVTVQGRVADAAALATLRQSLEGIAGVRVVSMDGVDTLPVADPFEAEFVLSEDGWRAGGVVPSAAVKTRLETVAATSFAELSLAAGAPDGWGVAAAEALSRLVQMGAGTLSMSDTTMTLEGVVDTPADRDRITEGLAALRGLTFVNNISVRDDGLPFRLQVDLEDGAIRAEGKIPSDVPLSILTDRFEATDGVDVSASPITAPQDGWAQMADTATAALAQLIEGALTIEGTELRLVGDGSPDGIAEARRLLADIEPPFSATSDLGVFGADRALELTMAWDGTTAQASGVLPAEFVVRGPVGTVPDTSQAEVMFLPDTQGTFTANADAAVAALGLLRSGQIVVTETAISLTGTATSPLVNETLDAILQGVADTTTVTRDLTFLDDGSPAAWVLSYEAETGGTVEGRLPVGLTEADLAAALGLPEVTRNAVTALEDDDAGNALAVLQSVATYLPDLERLTFARNGEGGQLDLVVSPSVEIDLIAQDLAETLPQNIGFSIGPLDPLPPRGTRRQNRATGLDEVFLDGFWIPDLNFETTLEGCSAESRRLLEQGQIGFLSGSAQLDAASTRRINALASVAVPCVEADLELEVAGHTDASGDADANQVLSQERAQAVRNALIARGVPPRAITAIGFGQTQPIADNATPEGRAANRRTEIAWFERGALRDP